ncbi:MAG: hypothetical protein QF475_01165 [Candidatus Undinarchaeales archaeon]|jgi:hypothetical protein|nr:hypothetical protein [Candidatus Undinarchaeales archaeon]
MKSKTGIRYQVSGIGSRWLKITLIVAVLLIALPAQAFALGISPGERVIKNQPGKTFEYVGLIVNNEYKDMTVNLEVGGDLKQFVSVEPKELNFTREESQKTYIVQVLVPFTIEPGQNLGYILASEEPEAQEGEMKISTTVAVKSRIVIASNETEEKQNVLEKVDAGDGVLETESGPRTTGLVVGKESRAGLFQNKMVGIILLISGLLIMGGLMLIGVNYQKQASQVAVKKKEEKRVQKQVTAQEQLLALEDYIQKCRNRGISKEKIKARLIQEKWDEKVINKLLKRAS